MTTFPTPKVGDLVTIYTAPGRLLPYKDRPGLVIDARPDKSIVFLTIRYTEIPADTGGVARDVPANYCRVIPAGKKEKERAIPFYLHEPGDERTEAQRLADGCSLIEKHWGYIVFRVGQGRAAAICHKCSREQGRMVKILCKDCGSQGYAPSTNSTEGTPDTLIVHERWKVGNLAPGFLPVEWKDSPRGKRTDEQKKLEAMGLIIVVWDSPSLVAAIVEYERDYLHIDPIPAMVAYLDAR